MGVEDWRAVRGRELWYGPPPSALRGSCRVTFGPGAMVYQIVIAWYLRLKIIVGVVM